MSIRKIDKKYCLGNRAQLMLIRGDNQAVFNINGILYLRLPISKDEEINIHRYLYDKDRNHFPYHDKPVSEEQHNHIFDCDTIYADITCAGEQSTFNFKLFKKLLNGDVLVEELGVRSFDCDTSEFTADAETVKNYLERQPQEEVRFVFDMWSAVNCGYAISYASANVFAPVVDRLRIPLDNESILEAYNRKIKPIPIIQALFFEEDEEKRKERQEQLKKEREERAWEKKSIDEVEEFSLTETGFLNTSQPYIIVVENGKIIVKHFEIRFIRENEFLIKEKKYTVSKDKFQIQQGIDHSKIRYTGDPTYIPTKYPPKEVKKIQPVLIKTWEELVQVPPTDKFKIVIIDNNYGYIAPIYKKDVLENRDNCERISKDMFHEDNCMQSIQLLQRYGFNVEIDNWKKEQKGKERKLLPSWLRKRK